MENLSNHYQKIHNRGAISPEYCSFRIESIRQNPAKLDLD